MNLYIRCAVVSFASLVLVLSSNLMDKKVDIGTQVATPASASVPAATLAETERFRTN